MFTRQISWKNGRFGGIPCVFPCDQGLRIYGVDRDTWMAWGYRDTLPGVTLARCWNRGGFRDGCSQKTAESTKSLFFSLLAGLCPTLEPRKLGGVKDDSQQVQAGESREHIQQKENEPHKNTLKAASTPFRSNWP